jgi:hypothetical protein
VIALVLVAAVSAETTAMARQDRFLELLRGYPERPPAETFRQVAQLIDEGPFAERDRAEYWIGSARLAGGDRDGARAWFARLARDYPGSVWEERSLLGLGDAAAQERRFALSLQWYGRASAARDAAVRELAHISSGQVLILRARQRLAWAAGIFAFAVALFFVISWRRARGPLWPMPAEARIVLPVLAVLALLSVKVDPAPRAAILELCAGGAALVFLSGLRLRALRLRGFSKALHALLALAAVACLAYVAVYDGDLVGMVMETFRAGPE